MPCHFVLVRKDSRSGGSTLERDFSLDLAVRKLQMTKVSDHKGNLPLVPLSS